jgi:hypothetical protein
MVLVLVLAIGSGVLLRLHRRSYLARLREAGL